MTVDIAPFNGTINLTYKQISDTLKLEKLLEDAHKLSYKHTSKADYINEIEELKTSTALAEYYTM